MKKILQLTGLILRFNQFWNGIGILFFTLVGAALIWGVSFFTYVDVFHPSIVSEAFPSDAFPRAQRNALPWAALYLTNLVIELWLHFRIFSLGARIAKSVRDGSFGTDHDLNTLKQIRIALLFTFVTSLINTLIYYPMMNAFAFKDPSDPPLAENFLMLRDLVLNMAQFFFIRFGGLGSLFAALLVFGIEKFQRENRLIKNELEQVI